MAQGYGIGMSARPLDLASGGLSFFNSAVQARKQEIKDHMIEASENEKKILDALDVKKLGEVAYEVRGRFDKEIGDYRNKLVDMYKSKQGRLSNSDLIAIESGSMDLHNKIADAKNHLEKYDKALALVANPEFANGLDDKNATALGLGEVMNNIKAGKGDMDAMKVVFDHIPAPSPEQMLANEIKKSGIKFDSSTETVSLGNGFTQIKEVLSPQGKEELKQWALNNPRIAQSFSKFDPATNSVIRNDAGLDLALENMFGERSTASRNPQPRVGRTGTAPVDLLPTTKTIEGVTYKDFYPINTPMTTVVAVNGTRALGTNEDVSSAMTRVTPIGISPSGKMAIGEVAPDGRPHPIVDKDLNVVYDLGTTGKPKEATFESVKNEAERAYTKAGGAIPDGYDDVRNIKYDVYKNPKTGAIEISGRADGVITRSALNPSKIWKGKETVTKIDLPTVSLKPMTSTTSKWYVEIPISEANMGDFAPVFKKYNFAGEPSKSAISAPGTQSPAAPVSGFTLPGLKKVKK